ncbi:hypothetical protein DL764_005736 [Monosporascus ibericus]|uniref:Uncharacterized protein n=1 Tax=Monosporascus ibericus TaxID=155417 RepID=A0A4Q4TB36_9PEZI|nr:hypothetical protein DL764_005736 [Monosporascus ibericus]
MAEAYEVKGKVAMSQGWNQLLLENGCSVMMVDLKLRPEANATLNKYGTTAKFQQTDIANWKDISRLWEATLEGFGRVDIVVNSAGIYEPPSSNFWHPPGVSPLAADRADAEVGQYNTFAVNVVGPIRLTQIAIDYWLQKQGGRQGQPAAATVSMTKSLGSLRKAVGIRNAAICPGAVDTPIFHAEHSRSRVRPGDLMMTPRQCAEIALRVMTEPQYGDGNIVEAILVGTKEDPTMNIREVPLETLYPTVAPVGQGNHIVEEELKHIKKLQESGMR